MRNYHKKANHEMSAWDVDAKSWRLVRHSPARRALRKRLAKAGRAKLNREIEKIFAAGY